MSSTIFNVHSFPGVLFFMANIKILIWFKESKIEMIFRHFLHDFRKKCLFYSRLHSGTVDVQYAYLSHFNRSSYAC